MITFYKITSQEPVVEYLASRLNHILAEDKKVLWLVPGGSALKIAAEVSHKLKGSLANLSVSLTDERYGSPGHADSNWQQLLDSGLALPESELLPVLQGEDLEATARSYEATMKKAISRVDYVLALAGMGADAHILGIKPHSPAINSQRLVEGYEWEDYQRLTLTIAAIPKIDELIIYAVGEEKHPVIDALEEKVPVDEQPAQALKLAKRLVIFNDHKGERL